MVPPRAAALAIAFAFLFSTQAAAQTPPFDRARDAFRESAKRPRIDDRIAGIRDLVDVKDVRAVEDMIAAVRVQEQTIARKREEIDKSGKEYGEIWKTLDDWVRREQRQGEKEPTVPADMYHRTVKEAEKLQKKLASMTEELKFSEAVRAALHDGLGRLLTSVEPAVRAPKILEIAAAAQRANAFEEKVVFIRIFGAIRAPESRDALIELATTNQDGRVRTAAVSALGELEDPTAIPTFAAALKDEVWSVATAAAQAMAHIPSVESVPALAEALGKAEGGTSDAFIKALEDITGVTFHDNGTLWTDWFKKEGAEIKASLDDLESGEPAVRIAAMNTLAARGTLAGVRAMLRHEGLDPPRDARAKVKPSAIRAAESRPAAVEEVETRRGAVARLLQSRPKAIRERAIATLILEPIAHAHDLDDDALEERYLRAAGALEHPGLFEILARRAESQAIDPKAGDGLRRAAIEGLGFQNQDGSADVLARIARSDKMSPELKALAVASLGRLRREASFRPLLEALTEKGVVAEAAGRALKSMTGQDFGLDRAAWAAWWNDRGKETAGLATRKTAQDKEEEEKAEEKRGGTTFYGIATHSKRVIYVLDISGSMNARDDRTATGGTALTKFDVAVKELKSSVAALPEDAAFNVIVFADGVRVWKEKLTTASKEGKAELNKWIDNRDPKNGILAAGSTNIFDALAMAFSLAGRGVSDKRYNLLVDTIMFMSDGQPNRGRIIQPSAIIAEIARMNEHKKVCVHTIGVGKDHDVELMKRIARLNGGTYVAR